MDKTEEEKRKANVIPQKPTLVSKAPTRQYRVGKTDGFYLDKNDNSEYHRKILDIPEGKDEVDIMNEREFMDNWMAHPETMKRGGYNNNTENYREGAFINEHVKAYDNSGWHGLGQPGYEYDNRILRIPKSYKDNGPIKIHEASHVWQNLQRQMVKPEQIEKGFKRTLFEKLIHDPETKKRYYTDPTELFSRLMEVRYVLNKKPGENINNDEYKKAQKILKTNGRDWFDRYDENIFVNWLNTLEDNNSNDKNGYLQRYV